jgi:hypothetical protein
LNESRNIHNDFVVISDGNVKEVLEVFAPRSLKTENEKNKRETESVFFSVSYLWGIKRDHFLCNKSDSESGEVLSFPVRSLLNEP